MKTFILNLIMACISTATLAQSKVTGQTTAADGNPIPYANVLLLNQSDTTFVIGTMANEQGKYALDAKPGAYIVRFSAVGFKTFESSAFELTSESVKELGTVAMQELSQELQEVVVQAEKPLFEQQIDRTIVNVQSSVLTKGSSALQVLERSPGVLVNRQNNTFGLNGKNGVVVMINGKIMRLSGAQLVTMLNGMNADDIEKIELLTTPPAKYDADGSAGMINIVLKKNEELGTKASLTLTGGFGKGPKAMTGINLTHNTGKINIYSAYTYSEDHSHSDWYADSYQNVPVMGGEQDVDFWNINKPIYKNHNGTIGIDVTVNERTTLGSRITYNNNHAKSEIFNRGEYNIRPDSFLLMLANINGVNRWRNTMANIYLEKAISKDEKLNIDFDYLKYNNESPTEISTSFYGREGNAVGTNDGVFAALQRGFANTPIDVSVLKIDYSKQLSEKLKMENGIKGTYTRSSSLSRIESQVDGEWVSNPNTLNDIVMNESIVGAYTSFNWQVSPSTNMIMGARYEYSDTRMNADKEENRIDRRFGKIFPSWFLSKKLNDKADLQLSYTKRIGRPTYNDLASFVTYNDPISVFTGNPSLRSVITHNVKFGYNVSGYSFGLLLSRDINPIAFGQLVENAERSLMYVGPQNLKYQNSISLQANLPIKVAEWWNINTGFNAGLRQFQLLHTKEQLEKTYFTYSAYGSNTITLPRAFSLEISGWYSSMSYNGSIRVDGVGMLNAGIRKELQKNMGSLQLTVSDVLKSLSFNSYFGHLTEEAFSVKSHVLYNTESAKARIIKLTYTKSFGNNKVRSQRQRGIGSKDERDRIR